MSAVHTFERAMVAQTKIRSEREAWEDQYAATSRRRIEDLCRQIDAHHLCSRASFLRGGIPCSTEVTREKVAAMMGGLHCHAEIVFNDGVRWLARFRLKSTVTPPPKVSDFLLQSEAATLLYLQQYTSVPVPKVFDWALSTNPENRVGVGYILMEKMDGKPLEWQAPTLTKTQKEKVMQQLVDILLEIEKHPFKSMGLLDFSLNDTTKFDIQGSADPATNHVVRRPPFSTPLERWMTLVNDNLSMIASGELDGRSPVDTYLLYRLLLDLGRDLWKDVPSETQFFLQHTDAKGDHILVNHQFDIVAIIDWEGAETCSKAEAFATPCMMWPVGKWYDGSNELTPEEIRLADIYRERGRDDLAQLVLKGRAIQRLFCSLGPGNALADEATFQALFAGLESAFYPEPKGWVQWKSEALRKWESDEILQRLLRDEEDRKRRGVRVLKR